MNFYLYTKQLTCITYLFLLFPCLSVNAQLIPDGSLGNEASQVNTSIDRDLIEGGAIRDNNLFHSFQEFNVNLNQKVYFNNPDNITNILTRVTGNNISQILGTLGVDGNANLFLMNPNGIVFGENSKLDIGGSFLGSTANSIIFDNYNFNTLNPEAPPLLKINVPLGLQFGSNPGKIEVQGTGHNLTAEPTLFLPFKRTDRSNGLRVNPGNTFALIGGDVSLSGGVITAETGKIELGAVNGDGLVGISNKTKGWEFDYSKVENFADIQLTKESLADVSGIGSGFVEVNARNLLLKDGSVLWTQNLGDAVSGDINVNLTDSLEVVGKNPDAVIRTGLFAEAIGGKGGNLTVNSKEVTVLEGGSIATYTYSPFPAGNLSINAPESILLDAFSPNFRTFQTSVVATTFGDGDAGNNTISTGNLTILGGASLSSVTIGGKGNAGDVTIKATGLVKVSGFLERLSTRSTITTASLSQGNAGDLRIDTPSLIMSDRATLGASTTSNGDGGKVTINAPESIAVSSNTRIGNFSIREESEFIRQRFNLPLIPSGNPGSITLNTPLLRLFDGGFVNIQNAAAPNPGELEVNANSIILENEGAIRGNTISGIGGNIQLNTDKLQINNGIINVSTSGSGKGGNININASESIEVVGAGFEQLQENIIIPAFDGDENSLTLENFSTGIVTASGGSGSSGNILIQTPNFKASNGGLIATTTLDTGAGGDIEVNADNILEVDNSLLLTGTFTDKDSGDIDLSARQLIAIGGAQVLTTTFDAGKAGNLTVNADSIDLIDPSKQGFTSGLFATSFQRASGDGGNINVKTGDFNIIDRAAVSVSGEGAGNAGDINIEATKLFLDNSSITARSISGEGGNINLSIADLLLLRNNSTISTQAGTESSGGGNGGNISFNGGFIVTVPSENSDINANAFQGNGGNISITTPGIFGIQFRDELTPQSDITASSEFGTDGIFNLNLQELDITSGLVELPENLTDAADRISSGCPTDEEARFITSGRGGIPQNPRQILPNEVVLQDLRDSVNSEQLTVNSEKLRINNKTIVEASAWIVNQDGVIEFIADNRTSRENISLQNSCKASFTPHPTP